MGEGGSRGSRDGGEPDRRGAVLLAFVLLTAVRIPYLFLHRYPVVMGDEAIYLYKARVFLEHFGYYAPRPELDISTAYMPLYSLFLAPAQLAADPVLRYRLSLLLNILAAAAVVFPAYRIGRRLFPAGALWAAVLAALWSVPSAYALSTMSEALFIPLFVLAVCCYGEYRERRSAGSLAATAAALAALVLTRQAAVALLPAAALAVAIDPGRPFRLARPTEMGRRAPLLLVPLAAWALWRFVFEASAGAQTISNYAARGLSRTVDSGESLLLYLRIWLGQLSYLHLASAGAGLLVAAWLLIGPRRPRETTRDGLLSTGAFAAAASLLVIFPGTVHMFIARSHGSPFDRYLMYGRYADMAVPLLVLFGAGCLSLLAGARRDLRLAPWRLALLAAVAFVTLGAAFKTVSHRIDAVHILNMGLAWYNRVHVAGGVPRYTLLAASLAGAACLVPAAIASTRVRRLAWVAAALFQLWNFHLVSRSQLFFEEKERPLYERFAALREEGGTLWYTPEDVSLRLLYRGKYFFLSRFAPLDGDRLPAHGDLVAHRDRILTADEYIRTLEE